MTLESLESILLQSPKAYRFAKLHQYLFIFSAFFYDTLRGHNCTFFKKPRKQAFNIQIVFPSTKVFSTTYYTKRVSFFQGDSAVQYVYFFVESFLFWNWLLTNQVCEHTKEGPFAMTLNECLTMLQNNLICQRYRYTYTHTYQLSYYSRHTMPKQLFVYVVVYREKQRYDTIYWIGSEFSMKCFRL